MFKFILAFTLSVLGSSLFAQTEGVSTDNPLDLAGKTCYAAFTTGSGQQRSAGAQKWTISKTGNDSLGVQIARAWGYYEFQHPKAAASGPMENLGEATNVQIKGNTLSFSNSAGIRYELTLAAGKISGVMRATAAGFNNNPTVTATCE